MRSASAPPDGSTWSGSIGIRREVVGHRAVLTVAGEVDIASAPVLAQAVDDTVAAGAAELWIDVTPTDFIDSSFLHLLLRTQARLDALNRRFAVISPGSRFQRVFDLAGVTERVAIYGDRGAAHRAP
jgi:anti-sigma B factor antagonist